MRFIFAVFLLTIVAVESVYDHRPGERYQTLLPNLNSQQLEQIKKLIYDQRLTKGQIFEEVKKWIQSQPPKTQYDFIKSQFDFNQKDEARNKALDAIQKLISPEAHVFNTHIRGIYDDPNISDRQTCEAVSAAISSTTEEIRQELNISPMNCARVFETLAH